MMQRHTYVVAGVHSWNRRVFDELIVKYPGKWRFVSRPDELGIENISGFAPRYIFFLHWSWKVPRGMVRNFECINFHMTDVPYGRGGSPLQHLIDRGHRHTKLSALRMVEDLDTGPVYMKEDLCLEGNAEEVYVRATHLAAVMIRRLIDDAPTPVPQSGEVVVFTRRKPRESRVPELTNLQALHDFIRMLDAEGYPRAYIEHRGFRYEFGRSGLYEGRIVADVSITPVEE